MTNQIMFIVTLLIVIFIWIYVIKRNEKLMLHRLLITLVIVITLFSAFYIPICQKALAGTTGKIYFIPGSGAMVDENGNDIFALSKRIKYKALDKIINVDSIVKNNTNMTIKMSGDGSSEESKITIVDANGNKYVSSSGSVGVGNGWVGMYNFINIPKDIIHFKILLANNIKIPVELKKAQSYKDYLSMGPTVIKNKLGLTLVISKDVDRANMELIEQPSTIRQVDLYGIQDKNGYDHINVSVKDSSGNGYQIEHPRYMGTLNEFSFKPNIKFKNYSLIIPGIRMHYKIDKEISFNVPTSGELQINKTINMYGFKVKFEKVLRQGDKLRIYVDSYYNKNKPENIIRFNLKNQSFYSWKFDDNIVAKYYEINIKTGQKKVKIQLSDMYTNLKGPWKFDFINK